MIPRDYQDRLVGRAVKALSAPGAASLAVSPTGSGKSLMLSWLIERLAPERALVLQHRDELVSQNAAKFRKVCPDWPVSLYDSHQKQWGGRAVFAMVQTLSRSNRLASMPPVDLVVIDESHRAIAATYRRIIDRARELNPDTRIAGFTATPGRGDGKGLRAVFDNCCDQITLHELVKAGFLVKPRTYIIELEGLAAELADVRKVGGEYDMDQAAELMDRPVNNDRIVSEWARLAADRKTIVFACTVDHARAITEAFRAAGVKADLVTGAMGPADRRDTLHRFDRGDTQVLVNVSVLTEGYDSQPVSCVVLLRPCSYKSTMLQMIGRGLRVVDPNEYPGVIKKDCLVLDFGQSLASHGGFDIGDGLDDAGKGKAPHKVCPDCDARIPVNCRECPICGFEFKPDEPEELGSGDGPGLGLVGEMEAADGRLVEVELFNKSPFRWVDLFDSGRVMAACGFDSWVFVVSPDGETWTALGGRQNQRGLETLAMTDRVPALARADDYLRTYEQGDAAKKQKRWLTKPATAKQLEMLRRVGYDIDPAGLNWPDNRYESTARLKFHWSRRMIEGAIL